MTLPSRSEVEQTLASFEGATPGPWRIKTDGNLSNCIEADSGKRLVLDGYKDTGYRVLATFQACCASDRADEQDANAQAIARLIAAATQLAEWVRTLSAEVERLREGIANDPGYIYAVDKKALLAAERDRLSAQLSAQSAEVERLQAAGNYVCDREVEPHSVTFADGRVVRVVGDGYLEIERAP